MSNEIYTPPNTQTLKTRQHKVIRVLLQGWAGTGKTHAALTFPNPYVMDWDNNLQAYFGQDIPNLPIWDSEFVSKTMGKPPTKVNAQPNRRDAGLNWLKTEGMKFTPAQTLIIDSWTRVQAAIDAQNELEPKITKGGQIDDFDFWNKKLAFSRDYMNVIASLRCSVVVTIHEISQRDVKTGALLDKVRPLQQGQFAAEISSYFGYVMRQITEEEKDGTGKVVKTKYLWQVVSDNQFEAIARPAFPEGTYRVPAHYDSFKLTQAAAE
jgi:hypothetical protein